LIRATLGHPQRVGFDSLALYPINNEQLSELQVLSIKVPDQKVFMPAPITAPITNPSTTKIADGKLAFMAPSARLAANAPEVTIRVFAKSCGI
jgi:hypothetical protein